MTTKSTSTVTISFLSRTGKASIQIKASDLKVALEIQVKSGADLSGADLSGADLSRAYLSGANLSRADLSRAYLSRAYLSGANLSRADLSRANLRGADLSGADLSRANLRGADLSGADLSRADLSGAKWRDGVIINRRPLFIGGLSWSVWVLDSHMQIGCELHKLSEWAEFDDRRICQMSGKEAVKFWRTYKDVLLAIAKSDGRE